MSLPSPGALFRLVRAALVPTRKRHRWRYVESDRVLDLVWNTWGCALCAERVRIPDYLDAYVEWEELSQCAGACPGRTGEMVSVDPPLGTGREPVPR